MKKNNKILGIIYLLMRVIKYIKMHFPEIFVNGENNFHVVHWLKSMNVL